MAGQVYELGSGLFCRFFKSVLDIYRDERLLALSLE